MSTSAAADYTSVIDVVIDDDAWTSSGLTEDIVRRAASAVLHELDCTPAESAVTVLLTGDARIRELNTQFRGKDQPTNVLSFPAEEDDYIGDIALAHGTVAREAEQQGIELTSHVSHLVVHGVLHLLGYDHQTDTDADKMETLEIVILDGLGIANPYAIMDRSGTARTTG